MSITKRVVVVTGGRDYPHQFMVADKLAELAPTLVVQGGAEGADRWARRWCMRTGTPVVTVHALWDYYDKAAGPVRNEWMFEMFGVSDTLAFKGGAGTESCVRASLRAGVPVWRCYEDRAPDYLIPDALPLEFP